MCVASRFGPFSWTTRDRFWTGAAATDPVVRPRVFSVCVLASVFEVFDAYHALRHERRFADDDFAFRQERVPTDAPTFVQTIAGAIHEKHDLGRWLSQESLQDLEVYADRRHVKRRVALGIDQDVAAAFTDLAFGVVRMAFLEFGEQGFSLGEARIS